MPLPAACLASQSVVDELELVSQLFDRAQES
jgi:hypothetical protein